MEPPVLEKRNSISPGPSGKVPSTSLRKMECLSCKIIVFPPVMQCKYWHSVCNLCRPNLVTCPDPDCHESIDSATRSSIAEKFLERHVLRCKYFNMGEGCMEAKLKEEADLMQAHETICYFREVKCLVPACYKLVRFSALEDHFQSLHQIPKFPSDKIELHTSKLILGRQICNETCGERSYLTALAYTVLEDSLFLALFRITSRLMPVFEISSVVHPYYFKPDLCHFKCEISARNEDDSQAHYKWLGPVNQSYPLTPQLDVRDELGKLKWIVKINIHKDNIKIDS